MQTRKKAKTVSNEDAASEAAASEAALKEAALRKVDTLKEAALRKAALSKAPPLRKAALREAALKEAAAREAEAAAFALEEATDCEREIRSNLDAIQSMVSSRPDIKIETPRRVYPVMINNIDEYIEYAKQIYAKDKTLLEQLRVNSMLVKEGLEKAINYQPSSASPNDDTSCKFSPYMEASALQKEETGSSYIKGTAFKIKVNEEFKGEAELGYFGRFDSQDTIKFHLSDASPYIFTQHDPGFVVIDLIYTGLFNDVSPAILIDHIKNRFLKERQFYKSDIVANPELLKVCFISDDKMHIRAYKGGKGKKTCKKKSMNKRKKTCKKKRMNKRKKTCRKKRMNKRKKTCRK